MALTVEKALGHGFQEGFGKIILFTDADLSSPIEECEKLFVAMKSHDVAIGSRAVDRSLIQVHETAFREFAGIVFNKIVRTILRLPFVDTQCGFKAFHRDRCRVVFEQQTIFWTFLLFTGMRYVAVIRVQVDSRVSSTWQLCERPIP